MMRIRIHALLLLSLALTGCRAAGVSHGQALQPHGALCAVYFSPHGGCTEEVVKAIREARDSVLVQAYAFTSQPIAQVLIEAHARGVKIDVILDRSQQADRRSTARLLAKSGIPLEIDTAHAIAHNKVMVIDGQTVLTGSFNFTEAAEERNAENLLMIRDAALAAQYARNWQVHRRHATPYQLRSR